MQRKLGFAIVMAGLVLLVPFFTGCGSTVQGSGTQVKVGQQPEGFWVSGTGEITVTPNLATISLGIQSVETSVADAQAKASDGMVKVIKALSDSGVNSKDIQTGSFNIYQRTRWDESIQKDTILSYEVTNMLTVKIRDVNKTGAIVDSAIRAGGDLIRINNLNFSVEDPSEFYKQAREKAIANARDKAEQYARLVGVTLGKPTYVAEAAQQTNPNYYIGNLYSGNMSVPIPASTDASISPGQNKIMLSVTVSYEIIN